MAEQQHTMEDGGKDELADASSLIGLSNSVKRRILGLVGGNQISAKNEPVMHLEDGPNGVSWVDLSEADLIKNPPLQRKRIEQSWVDTLKSLGCEPKVTNPSRQAGQSIQDQLQQALTDDGGERPATMSWLSDNSNQLTMVASRGNGPEEIVFELYFEKVPPGESGRRVGHILQRS